MNKTICVVGAGRWGKNHVRTLDSLGCLGGIVDADESTLEAFREKYPQVKTFRTVQEAAEESFDGFTVATPAETHFGIGEFLLNRKKPILIEKPIALTSTEARALKELADKQGVTLMVGHVLLFHPAIRKMKELIDEGKIGKLQYIYSNRLNLGTVRTEENILWSFAPHDISIFQYFTGSFPKEVISRGGAFLQPHIQDTTLTTLTYPDNIVGHIFVSWLHPFKEQRLVVIGSKGMFSFEDSSEEKQLFFYEKGIDWVQGEPIRRDGPTEVIDYGSAMPLTEEMRYFVERIDAGSAEIANADNALEVLEILEMGTESLASESAQTTARETSSGDFYVHPSSYVDDNVEIGDGTKIWHFSHVQPGARIGEKCSIGQNVNIANNVQIGSNVKIQNNVSVYEGVEIEDYVFCGPSMVFTNILDPRCKYPQRGSEHYKKTLVKEGASIGANATIVCGHTIGRHAFIGAGAVVADDVPDYALMVGVPAKRIGWVSEAGARLPEFSDTVKCPRTGIVYGLQNGTLVELER